MLAAALGTLLAGVLVRPAVGAADCSHIDRLYFHRDQGRELEESISEAEALLSQGPADPGLLWRLARSLVRSGEKQGLRQDRIRTFRRAEEAARRAAALAPDAADAHFWLGVAMGRRGQAQGVLRSLFMVKPLRREMETALRLDPRHGGAHHVLAEVYAQLPAIAGGSKKAALREFELAVSLSPDYTTNYISLARAYAAAGRKGDATSTLLRLFAVKAPADPAQAAQDLAEGHALLDRL